MKQPSFNVYVNRETGDFVVVKQFERDGMSVDTGSSVHFKADETEKFFQFVEDYFAAFQDACDEGRTEIEGLPANKQNVFAREHKVVGIYLPGYNRTDKGTWVEKEKYDEVVLVPYVMKTYARRTDLHKSKITLEWPTTPGRFLEALTKAFDAIP